MCLCVYCLVDGWRGGRVLPNTDVRLCVLIIMSLCQHFSIVKY